ncbi:MAG: 3-hydroxyacyl-CoA dehydrogenase NAD-binding domain-containing protein [Sphingomonadales bacterium]
MANLIKTEISGDIAIVWADNPPVNAISHALRSELKEAFGNLKNSNVKAVILACRGRTFFAGADISEFDKPPQAPHLQDVFNVIEGMNVPVIAALFGTALGGGMEASLACHYRIALKGSKMGLPEIHLGIFPGAGGTQRLPRLISLANTLEIIIKGKPISADKALELGILDKIVEGDLIEAAKAFAKDLIKEGHGPRRVSALPPKAENSEESFKFYETFIATRLRGRKNPALAMAAIRAALDHPFTDGLAIEKKLNLETKQTLESQALRHVFFAERKTRVVPGLSKKIKPEEIKTVGVIGAGTMGGGIAMCFASAGIPVTLVETSEAALTKGLGIIKKNYTASVQKGRLSESQMKATLGLISGTTDLGDLKPCDLVIEAVFEDMAIKKEIFLKLDQICKPRAILATNTSTLDVDEIANCTNRPEYVLGLHFFSPANIMPLLEVVRGKKTSDQTLITALNVGKKIRKTAVVSGVCFGFIGNRMLSPYGREAQRMLLEGANPKEIDQVLEGFGMAMGVLAVYDLAGIDVGHKIREAMGNQKPKDPTFFKAGAEMFHAGRYGQKTGAGFYKYEPGSRQRFEDPRVMEIISKAAEDLGITQRKFEAQEIFERCLYPLVNEAANILDQGIALRASDIDVVWTSGYGFPRHLGGPMFWADTIGLLKILEGVKKYQEQFGPEFWQTALLLEKLVAEGKTFADWDRENV